MSKLIFKHHTRIETNIDFEKWNKHIDTLYPKGSYLNTVCKGEYHVRNWGVSEEFLLPKIVTVDK